MAFKDLDLDDLEQANGGWFWSSCWCPPQQQNPAPVSNFWSSLFGNAARGVPLQSQVDPFYSNGESGADWGGGGGYSGDGGGHGC